MEGQEFVKIGGADGPQLNTDALKSAAHTFLNKGTPASTSTEQPQTSTRSEPVSPIQQIPVTVSSVSEPQVPAQNPAVDGQTPEPAAQKPEVNLLELADDQIVRMKVGGDFITMTAKEAREGMMKGARFTREMQQLRSREEQFAGRLSDAEKLEQVLTDDTLLGEYIVQTRPQLVTALAQRLGITRAEAATALATEVQRQAAPASAPPPAAIDLAPGELVNFGEVSTFVNQQAQTLEQKVLEQLGSKIGEVNTSVAELVRAEVQKGVRAELSGLQKAHEISTFDGEIKSTIKGILDANPALKHIPGIEANLRIEVFKMRPKSPEEMLEAFSNVAQGIVEGLDETYNTARKITVIDKATMEATGIEPPAGSPATTMHRPISYAGPDGKVDFKNIRAAAKAALGVG